MLGKVVSSPLGDIMLCAHQAALAGLWFVGQKYECAGVDTSLPESPGDREVLNKAELWLRSYFAGERPTPDFPLAPCGTDFQKRVWTALLAIGYGKTISYGELADRLGTKSARAVGAAVGRNPISLIIPCHRVLGSRGSLTGYAGGLERKRALLKLESFSRD